MKIFVKVDSKDTIFGTEILELIQTKMTPQL